MKLKKSKKQILTWKQALGLAAPQSWTASVIPAVFAAAYCRLRQYPLEGWKSILLTAAVICMQSAVNTLNDYMDFVKGTDSVSDHLEQSDAVLIYSDLEPKTARDFGLACLLTGLVMGGIACLRSSWLPILIGFIGAVIILLYSGGPQPISYLPAGEIVSGFVMGGLIPLGIAACSDGKLHADILLYSIPLMIGIALIMMSNNGCDIEKDRRAGRHTFPAMLGREKALTLYKGFLVLWIVTTILFSFSAGGIAGIAAVMILIIFGMKIFIKLIRMGLRAESRILQMKGIAAANLCCGGAYIVAILIRLTVRASNG